eukprot:TRINITY_DN23846_c0_g1_i3.p1 TRINITY_DN23846_c0_g1~~TRINITY_DN23846_c0_g1_i3.p1  ORF type:complete len:745 (-),score=148.33 TRINITY_DN23846_c0_g1_i3:1632-3866(-)
MPSGQPSEESSKASRTGTSKPPSKAERAARYEAKAKHVAGNVSTRARQQSQVKEPQPAAGPAVGSQTSKQGAAPARRGKTSKSAEDLQELPATKTPAAPETEGTAATQSVAAEGLPAAKAVDATIPRTSDRSRQGVHLDEPSTVQKKGSLGSRSAGPKKKRSSAGSKGQREAAVSRKHIGSDESPMPISSDTKVDTSVLALLRQRPDLPRLDKVVQSSALLGASGASLSLQTEWRNHPGGFSNSTLCFSSMWIRPCLNLQSSALLGATGASLSLQTEWRNHPGGFSNSTLCFSSMWIRPCLQPSTLECASGASSTLNRPALEDGLWHAQEEAQGPASSALLYSTECSTLAMCSTWNRASPEAIAGDALLDVAWTKTLGVSSCILTMSAAWRHASADDAKPPSVEIQSPATAAAAKPNMQRKASAPRAVTKKKASPPAKALKEPGGLQTPKKAAGAGSERKLKASSLQPGREGLGVRNEVKPRSSAPPKLVPASSSTGALGLPSEPAAETTAASSEGNMSPNDAGDSTVEAPALQEKSQLQPAPAAETMPTPTEAQKQEGGAEDATGFTMLQSRRERATRLEMIEQGYGEALDSRLQTKFMQARYAHVAAEDKYGELASRWKELKLYVLGIQSRYRSHRVRGPALTRREQMREQRQAEEAKARKEELDEASTFVQRKHRGNRTRRAAVAKKTQKRQEEADEKRAAEFVTTLISSRTRGQTERAKALDLRKKKRKWEQIGDRPPPQ